MLTRKQSELLRFIHQRLRETGIPPSFDEMRDALDLRSKSGIHRLIMALEERGFIRRLPNRARALEVLRLPDAVGPGLSAKPQRGGLSVIQGDLGQGQKLAPATLPQDRRDIALVPLVGRIAAGTPISALQHTVDTLSVPIGLLGAGEHFALEVRGDSMVEAGILDGDTVLIHKQATAHAGDIVVALVDDEEATLKRFRRKGHAIALEPANPAYETRVFSPDRVAIQGRLIGLLRRY